ncbi:AfsR/SARP family transcriptional regulator [Micromonospora sp. DT231]|uniref:AfsR/SARP family transcriptional regulator n=1 Tax=Micromonospora sp. DT231 TaxID=3416526 RepID=UPI003CE966CC
MGNTCEFLLLGPLEVRAFGRLVPITAARQQITLAMLLLNPGQVVSVQRLTEALWADQPPARPENQIAICVSALRRSFVDAGIDRGLLVTRSPGYLISVDDDGLDTRRVLALQSAAREAAAAGQAATAADRLREALAIWRGPALSGLTSRLLEPEAVRWEELRLGLVEECVELEFELGMYRELIGELTILVAAHPLRERPRRQLMLALYHAGRQAEALAVYQDARLVFERELGLEPGAELRGLHDAMLRGTIAPRQPRRPPVAVGPRPDTPAVGRSGDGRAHPVSVPAPRHPAGPGGNAASVAADRTAKPHRPQLEPAAATAPDTSEVAGDPPRPLPQQPRMLPAQVADFTGREADLAFLVEALTHTPDGNDHAVRIAAVAGPGGIGKTTLAVAAAHRLRGVFPDGQLYVNLNGAEHRQLEPLEVLAVFLRELGVDNNAIPDDVEQRAAMYRSILAERRILVVLDNAADEVQVQPLLPGAESCAALVTSRSRLTGLSGVRLMDLDVLHDAEAVELVRRIVGDPRVDAESKAVAELVRYCGGLPLAVRIVSARLAARSHQRLGTFVRRLADQSRRLDELAHGSLEVRTSVGLSYLGLKPRTRRLFRRLGLLATPDFAAWVGAPLMETGIADAEEHLERLVDAQLLDVVGRDQAGQLRYRFHDLVRLYAQEQADREDPPVEREQAVARILGAWLALVERAHVDLLGGDYAVVHSSAQRWPLEPEAAEELLADPAGWYESERRNVVSAVEQAAQYGLLDHCWDLAVSAVSLFGTRSHYDEWRSTHEVALLATRAAGNARGEAAVLTGLGDLYVTQHRYDAAVEYLEPALAIFSELGDRHGYAVALRKAGYADSVNGNPERAVRRYEEALELLRETGDRGAEEHVLRWMGQFYLEADLPDRAEPYLLRAMEMSHGSRRASAQARYRLGELDLARGRLAAAERAFTEVLGVVEGLRDRRGQAYALHGLGRTWLGQGRAEEAAALLYRARDTAAEIGDRLIEIPTLLALAQYERDAGRPEPARELIDSAARLCRQIHAPIWLARCHQAMAALDRVPHCGARAAG